MSPFISVKKLERWARSDRHMLALPTSHSAACWLREFYSAHHISRTVFFGGRIWRKFASVRKKLEARMNVLMTARRGNWMGLLELLYILGMGWEALMAGNEARERGNEGAIAEIL